MVQKKRILKNSNKFESHKAGENEIKSD